ncbi:hypothetical protein, partial [Pseudomonas coleopterorum]|uniref:hypothetical protein n=1 Tax=Pseudomonas coleopterorum TaxID=1605838 RepID=UPI001A7E5C43
MPESSPTYRAEPGRGSRRCYTGGANPRPRHAPIPPRRKPTPTACAQPHGGANPRPRHAPISRRRKPKPTAAADPTAAQPHA